MRYSAKQYAATLLDALEGKTEKEQALIFKRFLVALARNKDWTRLAAVVREFERQYLKKEGLKKIAVETAGEVPAGLKKEIEAIFGKKIFLSHATNPGILGGVKILVNDEILIDASARRQIERMFAKNR